MKRFSVISTLVIVLLTLAICTAFGAETSEKRLNLNLTKVPFPEAIRNIFYGSQDRFWVDPALNYMIVTAALKNVTRDQAITVITRTSGVVCSLEGSVYTFRPDPRTQNMRNAPAPNDGAPGMRGPSVTDVITLRCVSAGDAASLLNASPPAGLESITATSANTLLIKGDVDSIRQAKEMIRLFDVESSLPRSARMVLSLKLSAVESKSPINLSTQSVGPENSPIPLSIDFNGSENDSYNLNAKLIASVLPDGSISLTGSGWIDCRNCGGDPSVQHMRKSFEVAASVIPGRPAVIASGSVAAGERNLEFSVSANVTIEKGRVVMPRDAGKPDEPHLRAADAILEQIWKAQGQARSDAIDAVVRKYSASDTATQNAIAWSCLMCIRDKGRGMQDRWPCCYVISRCGYEPGVPDLIDVLLHDSQETMRMVAAEALGGIRQNAMARSALMQARQTETSARVQEAIVRYMGTENR